MAGPDRASDIDATPFWGLGDRISQPRRPWWRGVRGALGAALLVAALLVAAVALRALQPPAPPAPPPPQTLGALTLCPDTPGSRCDLLAEARARIHGKLSAVAALSPRLAWAVGRRTLPLGRYGALIERWDGARWRVVTGAQPPPNRVIGEHSELTAVAASSPRDVWAAGTYRRGSDYYLGDVPFFEHWDGARWRLVSAPRGLMADGTYITGLSARTPRDAWAVGYADEDNQHGFVLHWDGQAWSEVASGAFPTGDHAQMNGVAALSARDVWAVGVDDNPDNGQEEGLILHWDGRAWAKVEAPPGGWAGGNSDNYLTCVAALSARDVWAFGPNIVAHWDGDAWTRVDDVTLDKISSTMTKAGRTIVVFTYGQITTWDGNSWSAFPAAIDDNASLAGSGASGARDVWAVGNVDATIGEGPDRHDVEAPLIIHDDGRSWRVVPNGLP